MNEIHVCFSTDDNYAPYCGVAILSMFQNKNPEDRIFAYILYGQLTAANIEKLKSLSVEGECQVETMQIYEKDFENLPVLHVSHYTIETYYRFSIARIFPHIEKMLYLDCDILVKGSLWELYSTHIHDFPLAMAKDPYSDKGTFNAGVTIINCCQWRKEGIENALYQYAYENKERIRYVDQDVINGVLLHRIYEIDKKWNEQIAFEANHDLHTLKEIKNNKSIRIIHFIGLPKPWHGIFQNALVDEYIDYMKRVPWKLPDRRVEYADLSIAKYYNSLWRIRNFLKQGRIRRDGRILLLHETAQNREVECAARDTGIQEIKVYLIKVDEWKKETADYLMIEYHNLAIINHILLATGYNLLTDSRIVLIPEMSQKLDDQLLAMEYMAYLQQLEMGQ